MTVFNDEFLKENYLYVSHHHFKINNDPVRHRMELLPNGDEFIGTLTFLNITPMQKKAIRAFLHNGNFISILDNCATSIQFTPAGTCSCYVANVIKKVYSNTSHLINKDNFDSFENTLPEEITDDDPIHIVFSRKDTDEPPYDKFGYIIN